MFLGDPGGLGLDYVWKIWRVKGRFVSTLLCELRGGSVALPRASDPRGALHHCTSDSLVRERCKTVGSDRD